MKKLIIIVVAAILFGGCGNSSDSADTVKGKSTSQTFKLDTLKLKTGSSYYQCEMHLEIISDKPGNCPKCEMDLVKMIKK